MATTARRRLLTLVDLFAPGEAALDRAAEVLEQALVARSECTERAGREREARGQTRGPLGPICHL